MAPATAREPAAARAGKSIRQFAAAEPPVALRVAMAGVALAIQLRVPIRGTLAPRAVRAVVRWATLFASLVATRAASLAGSTVAVTRACAASWATVTVDTAAWATLFASLAASLVASLAASLGAAAILETFPGNAPTRRPVSLGTRIPLRMETPAAIAIVPAEGIARIRSG